MKLDGRLSKDILEELVSTGLGVTLHWYDQESGKMHTDVIPAKRYLNESKSNWITLLLLSVRGRILTILRL